jgi:hypothetical protein
MMRAAAAVGRSWPADRPVAVAAAANSLNLSTKLTEFAAQLLDMDVHGALRDAGADDSLHQLGATERPARLGHQQGQEPELGGRDGNISFPHADS